MIELLLASGAEHDPLEHVIQHEVWKVGFFTLMSNQIFMQILAALLVLWIIPPAVRRRAGTDEVGQMVPRGFFSNAVEWLCMWLRDNVARPALGKYCDQFVGYLWTVFFFILACNLVGMLPLDPLNKYLFGPHISLLGGTPTSNVWVTATLAICTLGMIVYHGCKEHGWSYIQHFFSVGPKPFNVFFFAPLEIVGFFVRIFALTIRLFANMLAGHILLAVLIGFLLTMSELLTQVGVLGKIGSVAVMGIIVTGSVAISALEMVLVVPLQALIFTLLTAVFIGQAVNLPGHDDHEHEKKGQAEAAHAPAHA